MSEIYMGVYKDGELISVLQFKDIDSVSVKFVDSMHDFGYVLKKIAKEDYDEFTEGDELTMDDIKNNNYIIK